MSDVTGDALRNAKIVLANTNDGSIIKSVNILDSKGKLFLDETSYASKYRPLFSAELKFNQKQNKVGILVTREQVSPVVTPVFQGSIFTMFTADLSSQVNSKFSGTVLIKAKETTWSSIYGSTLTVSSNGAFTGMDLTGGGSRPPQYRTTTTSQRGINFFTLVDDQTY